MPWTRGTVYTLYARPMVGEIYVRGILDNPRKPQLTKKQKKRRAKDINGRKFKRKNR